MNVQRLNFIIKNVFSCFCTVLKNMIIIFSKDPDDINIFYEKLRSF